MTMDSSVLAFHHLGLAVRHPVRALTWLRLLGYEIGPTVRDDLQRVNLALCTSSTMPAVEVVSKTEEPGPLDKILDRNESQMYHLCYEVDNLESALAAIGGARRPYCVVPQTPAILFGGRLVSFYYLDGFGLVEMLER